MYKNNSNNSAECRCMIFNLKTRVNGLTLTRTYMARRKK